MTTRTRQTAIAAAMLLATAVATTSTAQVPTPEIHVIEETAGGGAASVYIMRAPLPNTVDQVGLAITCDTRVEVTVFLGAFPPAGTPVQTGDTHRRRPHRALRVRRQPLRATVRLPQPPADRSARGRPLPRRRPRERRARLQRLQLVLEPGSARAEPPGTHAQQACGA